MSQKAEVSQESEPGLWGRLLEGKFGKYLLPGIVAQSVLIGGGYATGREVVQYAARFGQMGWIGVIGVFLGFTAMNIAVFELARTYQTYDYRSLIKQVIWKFSPAFDISYIILATIIYQGIDFTSLKLALIIVFIFISNPTTAHLISKAAHKHGIKPLKDITEFDKYEESKGGEKE